MLGPIASQFIERCPADAARVLETAAPDVVAETLEALPATVGAPLLRAMIPHAAANGLGHLAPDAAAALLANLPVEVAAALLLRLESGKRGVLVNALPAKLSVALRLVLRFPTGSVGSLIDPRVVTLRPQTRIGEAAEIARRSPELLRKYLYVLDEAQHLTGVVDARQCVIQEPDRLIGTLEQKEPIALRARATLREASLMPAWERFAILPVTDHRSVFLGVVRRVSVFQALAAQGASAPKEDLVDLSDLALALADLYWSTAGGLFVGALNEEQPR